MCLKIMLKGILMKRLELISIEKLLCETSH